MKIDAFTHVVPRNYWDAVVAAVGEARLRDLGSGDAIAVERTRTLWDLDARFRVMDRFPDVRQVIAPSGPALELLAPPRQALDLARRYNDEMAELVQRHPDRFVAGVAYLCLSDVDAALEECRRAITELGLRGVFLHTPIYGDDGQSRAIDIPELMPLYAMMSEYDLPIWLHPRRPYSVPDYSAEATSKYVLHQLFGWPAETTNAMARLVYSGVLERYPALKVITHHCGGMVPFLAERIVTQNEWYEVGLGARFLGKLKKKPIEYFRQFLADTAVNGNTPALMCGHAFFGARNMVFGSDVPYDAELGEKYTRVTIASIESMSIPQDEKEMIFSGNAKRLLKLDVS